MPAPPIYRPGERIDRPMAYLSALRQYIVRLRDITDTWHISIACRLVMLQKEVW